MKFDFTGWATKNNIRCSDGRTIMTDAFAHQDGATIPLIWNHDHKDISSVIGKAILENRPEGVLAHCLLNNTAKADDAREVIRHGDIVSLSIFANHLKQQKGSVMHGDIQEVSLVIAPANPGAMIVPALSHSEDDGECADIYNNEYAWLEHADEDDEDPEDQEKGEEKVAKKSTKELIDELDEEHKNAVFTLLGAALESTKGDSNASDKDEMKHADKEEDEDEDLDDDDDQDDDTYDEDAEEDEDEPEAPRKRNSKEEKEMRHNAFETNAQVDTETLSHADMGEIISLMKETSVGDFRTACNIWGEQNGYGSVLQHDGISGFAQTGDGKVDLLFPEFKNLKSGAPELITNDQTWVNRLIAGVSRTPFSFVRTQTVDIRNIEDLRAKGFFKGNTKDITGNYELVRRETSPQTVYVHNEIHRDDVTDITDFDYLAWQYNIDKMMLNEELARAILFGDGREAGAKDKISAEHIRPIYGDDPLYTIYTTFDLATAKAELQGTDTSKNFSDNYVYAEGLIATLLYAREKYKGSGSPVMFMDQHVKNVLLLSRDMNGRRIYDSVADLKAALDVSDIITIEDMSAKRRTSGSETFKPLALVLNMKDYNVGSSKGGEISHFTDFNLSTNTHESLIETRVSGALTRVYSAIAIEEKVEDAEG